MSEFPAFPTSTSYHSGGAAKLRNQWYSFSAMLRRLHAEGVYLHPHQLAEFLLAHGLPVDLCYVPEGLKQKAIFINTHYLGDMAALNENSDEQPWDVYLGDFD